MEDVARCVELWYSTQRPHSGLGYKIPNEVYDEHLDRQRAA